MKLTTNEEAAVSIAISITPICHEIDWTAKQEPGSCMCDFIARPRSLPGREVELTFTPPGTLWFKVNRITWLGLGRKPIADACSIDGNDIHEVLSALFEAVKCSPRLIRV